MSKFIVRCVVGGTGITLAPPARNPYVAVDKAMRDPIGRKASCFVVFERKTGTQVYVAVNR